MDMNTYKFKTNMKCSGCIATVTPALDATPGISKWEVDLVNPDKILTVESTDTNETAILNAVQTAGFKIERTN